MAPGSYPCEPVPRPRVAARELIASYRGLSLYSVFQPITSVLHGTVVGYEALLRAVDDDGRAVPPPEVFDRAEAAGELLLLNRMVYGLHLASFSIQDPGDCWLFINISTHAFVAIIEENDDLVELAARHGMPVERIVIEVLESDIFDEEDFSRSLIKCKNRGFMIAIDDFGKGLSNFDRILNFMPSIVKFDMSLVVKSRSNETLQRAYMHLTALFHEISTMVLAEGIESVEDATVMMASNVDFLQGNWMAPPDASTATPFVGQRVQELRDRYVLGAGRRDASQQRLQEAYEAALERAAQCFLEEGDVEKAGALLFAEPRARRLFILDDQGYDMAAVTSDKVQLNLHMRERLRPLRPQRSSRFFHRSYFRNAMRHPERTHFISPVFSFVDATILSIVAKAVRRNGKYYVVCGSFSRI